MQEQPLTVLHPPAKIGIIGGGQLGKMAAIEAKRLGYYVTVLDPSPASPAYPSCSNHMPKRSY